MKQDIWKQNDKSKVFSKRKENPEDNINDYLNNQLHSNVKLIQNQKKVNSLEDIKRDIRMREEMLKARNNELVNENEIRNSEPIVPVTNFNKKLYFPKKDSLHHQTYDFEKMINDNDDNNPEKINQLVANNNIKIFGDVGNKANFIDKSFEDDKNKNSIIKFPLSFEENDEYFNEFDEQLINKIISDINKRENEDESYKIPTEPPIEPQTLRKEIIKNDKNNYITKNLIDYSQNYIEYLFELLSKIDINFSKISFCFVIDCSLYLGIKAKLFNLMIILSIIKILYILDIKFSILLSADDNYKVIIKKYNDSRIDYEELIEILYETIIIKRYRNNILKTIKTAVEFLKNENENMNTIYLGFFDCMDDSFTYPNYWLKKILNSKSNIFIIITEKTRLFKENNDEIINNMKKNFEETIQKNTVSKILLININIYKQFQYIDSIIKNLFSESFQFLNDISELKTQNNSLNILNEYKLIKAIKNSNNLYMKPFEYFEEIIKDENLKKYDQIFFFNNLRQKQKINGSNNLNKEEDIENPVYDKKEFPENRFFTTLKRNFYQDRTLIESIFYPNKATQKQLSTKGTEIDIMALILYTLRQEVQEPKIYLENKGGLIRDYSITIIIDNSKSCFCELNETHSFLTIINLFHIIYSMTIPSFDIIVTTSENEKPEILLFDKPSATIFKNYFIFEKLLTLISNPVSNTDLSESIRVVYQLKKKKRNNRDSYLFILTDGFFCKNYEIKINYFFNLCQNIGIKIFGIGIGIFSYKAQYLFDTFIYSVNPDNLLKALSKIFGKIIKTETELKLISKYYKRENLENIFKQMELNDKFYFEELRNELSDIEIGDDVFNIFKNTEKNISNEIICVEDGEDLEIYKKNILKGQKILMVMFWSFDLNKKKESPYVSPEFIDTPSKINGDVCIQSVIAHFGIQSVIVVDYESAINELLKTNNKGECNYYAVWIFCGTRFFLRKMLK